MDHINWLLSELSKLVDKNVITSQTSNAIKEYYKNKTKDIPKPMASYRIGIILIGVLGSLLIGLGIILIIANNWNYFPKSIQLLCAFFPLMIGQGICIYTLLKKNKSIAWHEGSSIFLFLSIGLCISIVSQIYHINGEFRDFVLSWMLLGLPLVYLLWSNTVSIFYLWGILSWVGDSCSSINNYNIYFFLLISLIIPYAIILQRKSSNSLRSTIFNFFFALFLIPSVLFLSNDSMGKNWIILHTVLFSFMLLYGNIFYNKKRLRENPYKIIGMIGLLIVSTILSFKESWIHTGWDEVITKHYSNVYFGNIFTFFLLIVFLFYLVKNYKRLDISLWSFMLFPLFSFIGYSMVSINDDFSIVSSIFFNIAILITGIIKLRHGIISQTLLRINLGMLILTILMFIRFFDSNIGPLIRGIIFIIIGIIFLTVNMRLSRKWHDK